MHQELCLNPVVGNTAGSLPTAGYQALGAEHLLPPLDYLAAW